ncbi:hypothetical protein HOG98_05230 [bacterium]|nr:hypothetical protein [bacterium]
MIRPENLIKSNIDPEAWIEARLGEISISVDPITHKEGEIEASYKAYLDRSGFMLAVNYNKPFEGRPLETIPEHEEKTIGLGATLNRSRLNPRATEGMGSLARQHVKEELTLSKLFQAQLKISDHKALKLLGIRSRAISQIHKHLRQYLVQSSDDQNSRLSSGSTSSNDSGEGVKDTMKNAYFDGLEKIGDTTIADAKAVVAHNKEIAAAEMKLKETEMKARLAAEMKLKETEMKLKETEMKLKETEMKLKEDEIFKAKLGAGEISISEFLAATK